MSGPYAGITAAQIAEPSFAMIHSDWTVEQAKSVLVGKGDACILIDQGMPRKFFIVSRIEAVKVLNNSKSQDLIVDVFQLTTRPPGVVVEGHIAAELTPDIAVVISPDGEPMGIVDFNNEFVTKSLRLTGLRSQPAPEPAAGTANPAHAGNPVAWTESSEGPTVASTKPAPSIARYSDATFYSEIHKQQGVRGPALGLNRPLTLGKWYHLEIGIRERRRGIPAEYDLPIRNPRQTKDVRVLVALESEGDSFEIEEPVADLILPPAGESQSNAYFRIRAKSVSSTPTKLAILRVTLLYKLQFLDMFSIKAEVCGEECDASLYGRKEPVFISPDRISQLDSANFDALEARTLHVLIDSSDRMYDFTFTTEAVGGETIALSGRVRLTSQQLEPIVLDVRKTLMSIAISKNLSTQLKGGDVEEYKEHLQKLAELGGRLWTYLFRQDPGSAIYRIGRWLQETPPPLGSVVQVSICRNAADFVFPWLLLYDRGPESDTQVLEEGFWGLRYVIEQRVIPSTTHEVDSIAPRSIELGILLWRFRQSKSQLAYIKNLAAHSNATLALGSGIDNATDARKYLRACKSQLVYFFTHGHTQIPNASRFGFTENDFVLLYERLSESSPLKEDWRHIYESITKRQYESDQSWIELTNGRLYLYDLYSIERLPSQPIVILNMCESAQITPSLSLSFIDFFLTRGAKAVLGTECPMRPVYADYLGRELISALLQGESIGSALLSIRQKSIEHRNPLGLAYSIFGSVDARIEPTVLTENPN